MHLAGSGRGGLRFAIHDSPGSEIGVRNGLSSAREVQSSTRLANGWEGPGGRKSGARPGQEAGVRDDNRTKSQSSHVPMPPRRCGTCCPPALGGACWGVYWRYCGCILAGAGSSLLQCVLESKVGNGRVDQLFRGGDGGRVRRSGWVNYWQSRRSRRVVVSKIWWSSLRQERRWLGLASGWLTSPTGPSWQKV